LGDIAIEGRIILMYVFKNMEWIVDWIHVAQDRVQWQPIVNTLLSSDPLKREEYLGDLNNCQFLK
jgi:hypothetical protein